METGHDDDEDEEDMVVMLALLQLMVMCVSLLHMIPVRRNRSLIEQRLLWDHYCQRHEQRGTLLRRLRMRKDSFDKLVVLLGEDLTVNEIAANKRGGPILPELCLYCTLRYLAGGSYLDICDNARISQSSLYRVVWKTITAIVQCNALKISFPKTNEEVAAAATGFASVSTEQAITNCVGVVDGYLLRIKVPAKKEAKNVRAFFSGHI
jgi:hypothetical protein